MTVYKKGDTYTDRRKYNIYRRDDIDDVLKKHIEESLLIFELVWSRYCIAIHLGSTKSRGSFRLRCQAKVILSNIEEVNIS